MHVVVVGGGVELVDENAVRQLHGNLVHVHGDFLYVVAAFDAHFLFRDQVLKKTKRGVTKYQIHEQNGSEIKCLRRRGGVTMGSMWVDSAHLYDYVRHAVSESIPIVVAGEGMRGIKGEE